MHFTFVNSLNPHNHLISQTQKLGLRDSIKPKGGKRAIHYKFLGGHFFPKTDKIPCHLLMLMGILISSVLFPKQGGSSKGLSFTQVF